MVVTALMRVLDKRGGTLLSFLSQNNHGGDTSSASSTSAQSSTATTTTCLVDLLDAVRFDLEQNLIFDAMGYRRRCGDCRMRVEHLIIFPVVFLSRVDELSNTSTLSAKMLLATYRILAGQLGLLNILSRVGEVGGGGGGGQQQQPPLQPPLRLRQRVFDCIHSQPLFIEFLYKWTIMMKTGETTTTAVAVDDLVVHWNAMMTRASAATLLAFYVGHHNRYHSNLVTAMGNSHHRQGSSSSSPSSPPSPIPSFLDLASIASSLLGWHKTTLLAAPLCELVIALCDQHGSHHHHHHPSPSSLTTDSSRRGNACNSNSYNYSDGNNFDVSGDTSRTSLPELGRLFRVLRLLAYEALKKQNKVGGGEVGHKESNNVLTRYEDGACARLVSCLELLIDFIGDMNPHYGESLREWTGDN